jgi:hypothetical protein
MNIVFLLFNRTGFFHLTPEFGLNYIANCRGTGFHPHPTEPLLFTVSYFYILILMHCIFLYFLKNILTNIFL